MLGGVGNNALNVAVDSNVSTGGAGAAGGLLSTQKDATSKSTDPQFGEIYKEIQAKYGAKAEKPREIKKTLGKDDFLRIMITQMKHQDPTNPFKAEQMATEMAQFTSVEQLQNMNQQLTKMTTANQPLERMAMTGMIGKVVTVDRARFPHTEGSNEALGFALPRDAAEVKVAIISETGETVLEKDLGPQKAGEQNFAWDGLKQNTLPSKGGNYMFRVEAKDERGQSMPLNPSRQARIIGVSFEGSEPVFLIGDHARQEKVTMRNIVRIETDGAGAGGGAIGSGGPVSVGTPGSPATEQKGANFISFQKGQGSGSLDPSGASPEAAQALAMYEMRKNAEAAGEAKQAALIKQMSGEDPGAQAAPGSAAPRQSPASSASAGTSAGPANSFAPNFARGGAGANAVAQAKSEEKGFPSGLSDPEQQKAGP